MLEWKLRIIMVFFSYLFNGVFTSSCEEDIWEKVPCNAHHVPDNCEFDKIPTLTVEDFDRCGPAMMNYSTRNYYWGAAGRRITYKENMKAYQRIKIIPKILRDVSKQSLHTSTLGQSLSIPIGISSTAYHNLAHPLGEIATVRGMKNKGTVMILSSYASTDLDEVAKHAKGGSSHLWMQTYIFKSRSFTAELVSRAEKAGFKAIVVTLDSPTVGKLTCNGRAATGDVGSWNAPNLQRAKNEEALLDDPSVTVKDLIWLRSVTKLPIVVKGILSIDGALEAVDAGVSAIFVSNHGGRQLDGVPPTIDVLPGIVDAVHRVAPHVDVYVDGGIRNGWDVYKAIASGAKMVFLGRPIIWGLAIAGDAGVRKILEILTEEFTEAMVLSGASHPSNIGRDTLLHPSSSTCSRKWRSLGNSRT